MRIILMGPQGSGKGTQAKTLAGKLGIAHISTGDLFRAERAEGSEIGKAIDEILNAGKLVPDQIVMDMLNKRLARDDCAKGFIADGFPRNLGQLLRLPMVRRVDHAVQLWVDTQTSLDRIASRVNCPQCKAVYGPKKPPAVEGVCDACGTKLEQREDDAALSSVLQRLEIYWSEMLPILEYYRSAGVLTTINGDQPIEKIEGALEQLVT